MEHRETVVRCEVCDALVKPSRTFRMNGHIFCTEKECIERGIKGALAPIVKAVEEHTRKG